MKIIATTLAVILLSGLIYAGVKTQSVSDNDSANGVQFAPASAGKLIVKSVIAKSGDDTATLDFYVASGSAIAPAATPTNGQNVITLQNAGNAITTGDVVVIVYNNRAVSYDEVSANTTGTVTLATGWTQAGASGDAIQEIIADIQLPISNVLTAITGDAVYCTEAGEPLRIAINGTTNNYLSVTVQD